MFHINYLPPTYLFPELKEWATTLRNAKMLSFFETSTFKVVSEAYYKHCPSSKPDTPDPFANCGETWLNDDRFCLSIMVAKFLERVQRLHSLGNDVLDSDLSSAILKIEWREYKEQRREL